jgi:drug/metabolite transporter (DMT)-like permease
MELRGRQADVEVGTQRTRNLRRQELTQARWVLILFGLMAWYGVNFVLGKGLHSYGFGLGGETYVVSFVIADLLFVAFGIWRHRGTKARKASSPAVATSERVAA